MLAIFVGRSAVLPRLHPRSPRPLWPGPPVAIAARKIADTGRRREPQPFP